jgi:hypothetical protein
VELREYYPLVYEYRLFLSFSPGLPLPHHGSLAASHNPAAAAARQALSAPATSRRRGPYSGSPPPHDISALPRGGSSDLGACRTALRLQPALRRHPGLRRWLARPAPCAPPCPAKEKGSSLVWWELLVVVVREEEGVIFAAATAVCGEVSERTGKA